MSRISKFEDSTLFTKFYKSSKVNFVLEIFNFLILLFFLNAFTNIESVVSSLKSNLFFERFNSSKVVLL